MTAGHRMAMISKDAFWQTAPARGDGTMCPNGFRQPDTGRKPRGPVSCTLAPGQSRTGQEVNRSRAKLMPSERASFHQGRQLYRRLGGPGGHQDGRNCTKTWGDRRRSLPFVIPLLTPNVRRGGNK